MMTRRIGIERDIFDAMCATTRDVCAFSTRMRGTICVLSSDIVSRDLASMRWRGGLKWASLCGWAVLIVIHVASGIAAHARVGDVVGTARRSLARAMKIDEVPSLTRKARVATHTHIKVR